ncbi:TAP42-like protein, partial [Dunaliella salina]
CFKGQSVRCCRVQVDQMDPSSKRAAKIEQFKANKALATQLAALEDKRAKAKKHQDHGDGDKETGTSGLGAWDEEDERMLWGATVQQAGLRALHQRQMLKEERVLLQHAIDSGQQGASSSNAKSAREEMEEETRQEVLNKLRGIAGTLATSSGRREELRSQVFRPSHNLPTRSLAEQADIEIADAQRRESSQRAQEQAQAARIEALGSDEDEEELQRTRAFDDFKDMHPRGHGNSKLKPCG